MNPSTIFSQTDTCEKDTTTSTIRLDTVRYQIIGRSTVRTISECECHRVSKSDTFMLRDTIPVTPIVTPPPPTLPPVTPPASSFEPQGFVPVLDLAFASKTLGSGWSYRSDWNGTYSSGEPRVEIRSETSSPRSAPTFLRYNWPVGAEQSPSAASKPFGASYRQLYISIWFRHSPNFPNNPSGTNKMFYIGTNNSPTYDGEIFFDFHGATEIRFRNQQPEPDAPARAPNINLNPCIPGTWYHLETVLQQSINGQANGRVQWWINGVLQGDYSNVLFRSTGNSLFDAINLDPIWGGGGVTSRPMWFDLDHIYISGLL